MPVLHGDFINPSIGATMLSNTNSNSYSTLATPFSVKDILNLAEGLEGHHYFLDDGLLLDSTESHSLSSHPPPMMDSSDMYSKEYMQLQQVPMHHHQQQQHQVLSDLPSCYIHPQSELGSHGMSPVQPPHVTSAHVQHLTHLCPPYPESAPNEHLQMSVSSCDTSSNSKYNFIFVMLSKI